MTLARVAPIVFVFLWSTGYIGAKYGLPFAPPFTFLLVRMVLASLALLLIARVLKTPFPKSWLEVSHAAVAGLLLHAGYLGGVFMAIQLGVSAGISSIIVNLQPVLVSSLAAKVLGETVTARQWFGLTLGFAGVLLAVSEKFFAASQNPVNPWGIVACVVALISSTVGTIYQKRNATQIPLVTGTIVQYIAAGLVFAVLAFTLEPVQINWTLQFVFALSWFVLVISLGAILLLMWLIRQTSASSVSSLFYLVPPLTALEAYFLFGERLGVAALLGLVLCAVAVALVVGAPKAKA
jgi:drug/metabolite transporter (DMT)-like permease